VLIILVVRVFATSFEMWLQAFSNTPFSAVIPTATTDLVKSSLTQARGSTGAHEALLAWEASHGASAGVAMMAAADEKHLVDEARMKEVIAIGHWMFVLLAIFLFQNRLPFVLREVFVCVFNFVTLTPTSCFNMIA